MSKANPSMQIAHTVRLYAVHRSAATCRPPVLSNDRRAIKSLPSEVLSPQGAAQARLTRAASFPTTASSHDGVYALHSSGATRRIDPKVSRWTGPQKLKVRDDRPVVNLEWCIETRHQFIDRESGCRFGQFRCCEVS